MLSLNLKTGRKNQIRVQLADIGNPLVGDKKYGIKKDPIRRMALHANYIEFIHPTSKENMYFRRNPLSNHPWNKFEHISRNSK